MANRAATHHSSAHVATFEMFSGRVTEWVLIVCVGFFLEVFLFLHSANQSFSVLFHVSA